MTAIEEIKKMREEGKSDQEIRQILEENEISPEEGNNLLAQATIKEAVTAPPEEPFPSDIPQPSDLSQQTEFTPSLADAPPQTNFPAPEETYAPEYAQQSQQLYPQEYAQQYDQNAQQNYDYNNAYYNTSPVSADTIAEIAEQAIAEKISPLKDKLEKAIDLKTTTDAKLAHLDERLQRLEKIIDRLQLSILQKIGEHVINVADLKNELIETQKSFKAIAEKPHRKKKHAS